MPSNALEIPTWSGLPQSGHVEFRPPIIGGNLQIDNANITPETSLEPLVFTVRRFAESSIVILRRKNNTPLQIKDAAPVLPEEYSDMSHLQHITAAECNLYQYLADTAGQLNPMNRPGYPEGTRYALKNPVGRLVLRQVTGTAGWEVQEDGLVLNAHATQKFLNLAGKVAVGKIAARNKAKSE